MRGWISVYYDTKPRAEFFFRILCGLNGNGERCEVHSLVGPLVEEEV